MARIKNKSTAQNDDKLYASLHWLEIYFYIITFTLGVSMAIYSLYIAGQEQAKKMNTLYMVRPWW